VGEDWWSRSEFQVKQEEVSGSTKHSALFRCNDLYPSQPLFIMDDGITVVEGSTVWAQEGLQ